MFFTCRLLMLVLAAQQVAEADVLIESPPVASLGCVSCLSLLGVSQTRTPLSSGPLGA